MIEITPSWPPRFAHTLETIVGKGGFEGIHPDDKGDLLIVEDVGGTGVNVRFPPTPTARRPRKQPNSFVYSFHPYDRTNLLGRRHALRAAGVDRRRSR